MGIGDFEWGDDVGDVILVVWDLFVLLIIVDIGLEIVGVDWDCIGCFYWIGDFWCVFDIVVYGDVWCCVDIFVFCF